MLIEPHDNYWDKFREWWLQLSPLPFVLVTNGLMILVTMVIMPILLMLGMNENTDIGGPDFGNLPLSAVILLAVIVAPVIETLIFQMLPLEVLTRWIKPPIVIVISAFFFAAGHADYSIWYAFLIFPLGIILAYIYHRYKHPQLSAYWITTLAHAVRNGIVLITILLME